MIKQKKLQNLCAILFLSINPLISNAAVETAIGKGIATSFAGKTVSNIINDFRLSGVGLIDQATHSGNALIARAGNEAGVLAKNLDFILKDDINLTFEKLSEERRALLIEAEAIRRDLNRLTDSAYNFKDTTALDLNSVVTSLPFTKKTFFLQSVRGLSFLPQVGDFRIQVMASTLGVDEETSTNIQVYKGQGKDMKLIPDAITDQSKQRFTAEISIPNQTIINDFNDNSLSLLPLTVHFEVTKKSGWWIFSSLDKTSYDVPIFLSLLPKSAASVVVLTKKPTYGWKEVGSKSVRYSTPNRNCTKKCRGEPTRGGNRIEFAVSGGPAPYKVGYQRFINPSQRCIGGNCGWSDSYNLGLTEYDTRLVFTWDTWSTPGTWEATANVQEYQVTNEAETITDSQNAYFGRVFELIVPADFTYGIVRVRTFTKQEYEIILGQADQNGILTYQGESPAGPEMKRILYKVNDPASVSSSRLF
jgi:hypothetical protein